MPFSRTRNNIDSIKLTKTLTMRRSLPIVLVTLIFATVSVLLFNLPGKSPQTKENRPDRMDLAMSRNLCLRGILA